MAFHTWLPLAIAGYRQLTPVAQPMELYKKSSKVKKLPAAAGGRQAVAGDPCCILARGQNQAGGQNTMTNYMKNNGFRGGAGQNRVPAKIRGRRPKCNDNNAFLMGRAKLCELLAAFLQRWPK